MWPRQRRCTRRGGGASCRAAPARAATREVAKAASTGVCGAGVPAITLIRTTGVLPRRRCRDAGQGCDGQGRRRITAGDAAAFGPPPGRRRSCRRSPITSRCRAEGAPALVRCCHERRWHCVLATRSTPGRRRQRGVGARHVGMRRRYAARKGATIAVGEHGGSAQQAQSDPAGAGNFMPITNSVRRVHGPLRRLDGCQFARHQ